MSGLRAPAAAAALAALLSGRGAAAEAPLRFEDAFSQKGAPAQIHLRASYADGAGASHALELWRDRDQHLRRKTDDRLDLYVDKAQDGDYRYRLVDHATRRLFEVSRTNLYRIGTFSDWPTLSALVTAPRGAYTIRVDPRPPAKTAAGACRWYLIETPAPGGASAVCWSTAWRLPLLIQRRSEDGTLKTVLTVHGVDKGPLDPAVFRAPDQGLFRIDANEDLSPSSDM